MKPGGAIVLSPTKGIIDNIGKIYAGRASSSPILDLFITLLSMGMAGYQRLLQNRTNLLDSFKCRLAQVAERHGERLLQCPSNTISFGITLDDLSRRQSQADESEEDYLKSIESDISGFGSVLFSRCVSGTRVVPRGVTKTMGKSQKFAGFGSSHDKFPHAYMTAACAIGLSGAEVDDFFKRLDRAFVQYKKKFSNKEKGDGS